MLLAARPTISFKKSEIKKTETTTRKRSNAAHLQFISYTNANCNSFCRTFFERSSDPLLVPSSTRTYFSFSFPLQFLLRLHVCWKQFQFVQENNNKKKKSLFLVLVLSSLLFFLHLNTLSLPLLIFFIYSSFFGTEIRHLFFTKHEWKKKQTMESNLFSIFFHYLLVPNTPLPSSMKIDQVKQTSRPLKRSRRKKFCAIGKFALFIYSWCQLPCLPTFLPFCHTRLPLSIFVFDRRPQIVKALRSEQNKKC